ncbi:helix-turn-helix domain-containing protein [Mesorhizobium sp. WSM2239]|uniref:Helix-turn-helix domain-containing protein n=2 Tax=unclassified Mesorhizobium TaxID=325217 RepID=A0AAU8D1I7_9HYPH
MKRASIDNLIEETIKETGGNLSMVARRLGLPYHSLVTKYGPKATATLPAPCPRPTDIKELGREHVRPFVIAIKRCGHEWGDEFADVLTDARRKFDRGTHEMTQSIDQGWVVQYLIPRRNPTNPRRFFHV